MKDSLEIVIKIKNRYQFDQDFLSLAINLKDHVNRISNTIDRLGAHTVDAYNMDAGFSITFKDGE